LDPWNTRIAEKHNFLQSKIQSNAALAEKWYNPDTKAINQSTLMEYGEKLDKLTHFTANQPGHYGTKLSYLCFWGMIRPPNIVINHCHTDILQQEDAPDRTCQE
jgi:hypothetical protein